MAWMPGASASGHSVQLRPISGAQSALSIALQPLGQVIAIADGKSLAAASAVFSPSTIRTGALGRCCSASRLYSGRGAGGAFHNHCEPSHHKGRIFLPGKRQIRKSGPYCQICSAPLVGGSGLIFRCCSMRLQASG